ncbi:MULTISPECIES: hypothetical protein [unclassified Rhizobium]|uniref:hypothetical protein n=1 Tax=unclassified Rhizobium TaxID=2613769 RepID=UPI0021676C25|nr:MULTISPECIES: hypothetical protein [unclassified Rhizobium]MCS3743362.1 hypothetical protein [Rhizobium sp. BK661]MCS4095887.1 hypothetical protein [Rhizobium sp. BK176]
MSPEWISAWANLMTGMAALLAGWAGMRGLNAWRAETVGRRKAELAEEVLAGFYRTRDILTWARFPASDADQDETDRPEIGQDDDEPEKSEIIAPVDRLTKESQVFSELRASRYRFMAYFGEEAARPFDEIRAIHNEIVDAARNLVRTHGQKPAGREQERDQWEAAIGWGEMEGDALKKRLDLAVKAVEQTCRPLIEERHKARRDSIF